MIAKETLGMFGIIAIIGFGGYRAFTGYQQASEAKQALAESNDQLNKASNQSVRLINETGKGVVYLAPKGATASKDDDGSKLHAILEQIFRYKSPETFAAQAKAVQPQVTGDFPNYWFHGGIDSNEKAMKIQSNGRNLSRYGKINLTKYEQGHYFAVVKTGVLMGDQGEDESRPVLFGLDIHKLNNNQWKIDRIPGFSSVDQNNSSSSQDSSSNDD